MEDKAKADSGYTIKDESQYLVFDNDGLLTKYVNETSKMKSTVEYAF